MVLMKTSAAAVLATSLGLLAGPAVAGAEPYPGCPFRTYVVYSICSDNPGVPGFTPGFTLTPGVPGTFGPQGIYTPVQDSLMGGQ